MTTENGTELELGDIQAGALMPRPHPYAGAYLALRIDDRHAGRELLRRLIPLLEPVASFDPARPVSLAVALSFQGLKALGVPEESLATFPAEFQQGMAARADVIGDVGDSAPEHWEAPLGSKDVHLVVTALAQDTALMEDLVRLAEDAVRDLPGVVPVWHLDVHVPADGREQFGFSDGISQPTVEGTGILGTNPHETPFKAGEFVLGYEDESGRGGAGAAAGGAGPQRHLRGVPQAAPEGGRVPAVPAPSRPRTRPSRSGWRPRWSGAGPAARRWPWPRTRTTRTWAATRSGTTPSCTAMTRGA